MNPFKNLLQKVKLCFSPRTKEKKNTGKIGEDIAAKFLIRKGYKILERNWRMKGGEIDIVAKDRDTMVFVEVKSRSSTEYGTGEEAITPHKKEKIINAAKACLQYKPARPYVPSKQAGGGEDQPCRFDVISILFDKRRRVKEINHIENAFTL
jgi:putative endonuclease